MSANFSISDLRFDGGRLGLDLINTVYRRPHCDEVAYLHALNDFLEWIVRKEWLTATSVRDFEKQAGAQVDSLLNETRAPRELLHRLFEPFAEPSRATLGVTDRGQFELLLHAARSGLMVMRFGTRLCPKPRG